MRISSYTSPTTMPTRRELRQQRHRERASADSLRGELRNLLISARLLTYDNRRSFKPDYISKSQYEKAKVIVELSPHLLDLGVTQTELLRELQSLDGLNRLIYRLKVMDLDLETVDAISPTKRTLMRLNWMMVVVNKDPAVKAWYEAEKINPDHPCLLVPDIFSFVQSLQLFLLHDSPQRRILLESTRFTDLLTSSYRQFNNFIQILSSGDESMSRLSGRLLSYPREDKATWGQRLEVLDIMAESTDFATGGTAHYEYLLAQAFPYLTGQADELSLDWLLGYGRALAEDTRSRTAWMNNVSGGYIKPKVELRDVAPTVFDNSLVEKSSPETYTYVDELESSQDPRFPLLPLMGVEVESNLTREINPALYNLLQDYVVKKGSGSEFELSAAPVRNPETLKLLYQKLFAAGLIDLFLTNDYSLHWNVQLTNPALLQESLMALSLTGYLTQARLKSIELNGPKTKEEEDGSYFEWKQGDLVFPEQLMIGIDALHAVATAQKAYEQALLVNPDLDTHLTVESLQSLPLTPAQILLAQVYMDFRQRHRMIMDNLRKWSKEGPTVEQPDYYRGKGKSFSHAAMVIRKVYPTLKDFLQVDPSREFTSEELVGLSSPEIIAPELIVAQAQKLASDMIHNVNKVLEQVYDHYLQKIIQIADDVNRGEALIPEVLIELQEGLGETKAIGLTPQARAENLIQRFQYVLRQPRLDAHQRQAVTAALAHLSA